MRGLSPMPGATVLPYPSRDDETSRPARAACATAGLEHGGTGLDLPACAIAVVLHPLAGGGLGNVGSRQLAGAAVQRRTVFAQDAVAAVVDSCGLGRHRRQRCLAAVVDGAAGFGDALSFGLTKKIRKAANIDGGVTNSGAYKTGGQVGDAYGSLLPSGKAAAVGRMAKVNKNVVKSKVVKNQAPVPKTPQKKQTNPACVGNCAQRQKNTNAPKKNKKYSRNLQERRKALLRDANDPKSDLTKEAREYIKQHDGKKVPFNHEVSHEIPLYTQKTNQGKKALDVADNMKTQSKLAHRIRHKICGDQYHQFGPANKPKLK